MTDQFYQDDEGNWCVHTLLMQDAWLFTAHWENEEKSLIEFNVIVQEYEGKPVRYFWTYADNDHCFGPFPCIRTTHNDATGLEDPPRRSPV